MSRVYGAQTGGIEIGISGISGISTHEQLKVPHTGGEQVGVQVGGSGWEVVSESESPYGIDEADLIALFEALPLERLMPCMIQSAQAQIVSAQQNESVGSNKATGADLPLLYSFLEVVGSGMAAYKPSMSSLTNHLSKSAMLVLRDLFKIGGHDNGTLKSGRLSQDQDQDQLKSGRLSRDVLELTPSASSVLSHLRVLLTAPGRSLWLFLPEIPFESVAQHGVGWRILAELCMGGSEEIDEARTGEARTVT